MPEIGEIARIVNRLRTHLVGKTILSVTAFEDTIVYKDTTHDAFKKALEGKKVLAAKQWGKYFWLVMSSPPHPLMHFGMTGWIYIKNDPSSHYRSEILQEDWPPKHLKFNLQLNDGTPNEIAFADPRRLSRIRLISHPDGHALRDVTPLKENGPDPVLEPISLSWLTAKLQARKIPVKAWLLDQSAIAGVGNWVGDEILFQARIHPECYSNQLSSEQIRELHRALGEVTKLAVDVEADSSKFPEDWLMLHRWGKGEKGGNKLPTGEKIDFVKVGGRTSAFVPSLQKKGAGKGVEDGEAVNGGVEVKPKKARGKRAKKEDTEDEESEFEEVKPKKTRGGAKRKRVKREDTEEEGKFEEVKPKKTRGGAKGKRVRREDTEEEIEIEEVKPKKTRGGAKGKRVKREDTEEESEFEDVKPKKTRGGAKGKRVKREDTKEESEIEEVKPKKTKGRKNRKRTKKEDIEEEEEEDIKPIEQAEAEEELEAEKPKRRKRKVENGTKTRGRPKKSRNN